jgi:spore germination protein
MRPSHSRSVLAVAVLLMLLFGTTVLAAPYGSRTLRAGVVGGDVIEFQRRLVSLGYSPGAPDGIYGSRTREAVIRFQRDYGLLTDGIAGEWTFRALDRAYTWQHGFEYTVRTGDSLWLIAQRNRTTVNALVWLNNLRDRMVYPGQRLRIPRVPDVGIAPRPEQPPAPTPPAPVPSPAPVPAPAPAPVPPPPAPAPPAPPPPQPPQLPAPVKPHPPASARPTILAFYTEDWDGDTRSLRSLRESDGNVDIIVAFQYLVDQHGQVLGRDFPQLMLEARKQGIPVHALIHNYQNGGFSTATARSVLTDEKVRNRLIDNLYNLLKVQGFAGINVDLENVPPDLRHPYTEFVRVLGERIRPEGFQLSLSIPAKTHDDPRNSWSGAFDYVALGPLADAIVPMAYDESSPGFPEGPIASEQWVDRVAAYTAGTIGREKVLLGVAAYAYDWVRGTRTARGMTVPQAMSQAMRFGAAIQWDPVGKVPFFTYVNNGQERIVYYENASSLTHKLEIVRKHGLKGIGIWRLGSEDPGIWPVLRDWIPR